MQNHDRAVDAADAAIAGLVTQFLPDQIDTIRTAATNAALTVLAQPNLHPHIRKIAAAYAADITLLYVTEGYLDTGYESALIERIEYDLTWEYAEIYFDYLRGIVEGAILTTLYVWEDKGCPRSTTGYHRLSLTRKNPPTLFQLPPADSVRDALVARFTPRP